MASPESEGSLGTASNEELASSGLTEGKFSAALESLCTIARAAKDKTEDISASGESPPQPKDCPVVNGTANDPADVKLEDQANDAEQQSADSIPEEEPEVRKETIPKTESSDEISLIGIVVEEIDSSSRDSIQAEIKSLIECKATGSGDNRSTPDHISSEPSASTSFLASSVIKNMSASAAQTLAATSASVQQKSQLKPLKVDSSGKGVSTGPGCRPVAKMLISIGSELVREGVIKNLIDIQTEKEKQQKLDTKEKTQLEKLEETWKSIVKKNETYNISVKRCRCSFVAFGQTALELHRQFGHGSKPGKYRCCYCSGFKTHIPTKFITHMGRVHKKFARLQSPPLLQCPFCPFEHKQSTHLDRHVNSCQKKFMLSRNLMFSQNVFDIPVFETVQRPRIIPMQVPIRPNPVGLPRASVVPSLSNQGKISNTGGHVNPAGVPNPVTGLSVTDILSACGLSPHIQAQVLNSLSIHSSKPMSQGQNHPATPRPLLRPSSSAGNWVAGGVSLSRPQVASQRPGMMQSGNITSQRRQLGQLGRGVLLSPPVPTQVIRQTMPIAPRTNNPTMRPTRAFIPLKCEICDQPVRELESLRLHFIAVHREAFDSVEFHKKGRTVCCQTCNERFWTRQGALRHYQMQHASLTPRSYQCIKCGAKIVTSILNHLSSQHNITVLDMYEAKFCMLCNTSLKSINMFETHVVSEHADIFPNRLVLLTMIKALNAASLYKTMGKPDLRPANQYIQGFGIPGRMFPGGSIQNTAFKQEKAVKKYAKEKFSCQSCCIQFLTAEDLALHCEKDHMFKCSRCSERWSTLEIMQRHFMAKHHGEKDPCILCGEMVQIGRPTVRHIKRMHIRSCSVVIKRLRPKEAMRYLAKRRRQSQNEFNRGCSRLDNGMEKQCLDNAGKASSSKENEVVSKVEEVMEVDGETIIIQANG